jgi:hypothetical protein
MQDRVVIGMLSRTCGDRYGDALELQQPHLATVASLIEGKLLRSRVRVFARLP